jgi:hypothetical protein
MVLFPLHSSIIDGLDCLQSSSLAHRTAPVSNLSGPHLFVTLSRSGLLLGKRREPKVWLDDPELWEELLSLLVLHTRVDDDVVTWNPVNGSCDAVLVARLQRVEDTEDLGGVAAGGGGV